MSVLDIKLQLIIIFYLRILMEEDSRQITRELAKGMNVDHSTSSFCNWQNKKIRHFICQPLGNIYIH